MSQQPEHPTATPSDDDERTAPTATTAAEAGEAAGAAASTRP
jgi:hypothetical protein